MSEEFIFFPTENYFRNFNISTETDLRSILKTKEIVSVCERMIRDYQFAFQKVSYNSYNVWPMGNCTTFNE